MNDKDKKFLKYVQEIQKMCKNTLCEECIFCNGNDDDITVDCDINGEPVDWNLEWATENKRS